MKRWMCDRCNTGTLAPARPRRDDVRRYCLKCSESTGRLVERRCPSLERERAERSARAAAKRNDRSDKIGATGPVHYGIDVRDEADALWKLMVEFHDGRPTPELRVRFTDKERCSGRANQHRALVSIGRNASVANMLMVLTHELAHSAAPHPGDWHDDRWADCFVKAARARYGAHHFEGVRAPRGYAVDRYVEPAIERYWQARVAEEKVWEMVQAGKGRLIFFTQQFLRSAH